MSRPCDDVRSPEDAEIAMRTIMEFTYSDAGYNWDYAGAVNGLFRYLRQEQAVNALDHAARRRRAPKPSLLAHRGRS